MLKIRLKRLGCKKAPAYRIIVINSTTKREGNPVQELGHYNPKTKIMKFDKETALEWVKKGAQPTETVQYLIDNCNTDGSLNYKPKTEKKLSKKAVAKLEAEKADGEQRAKRLADEQDVADPFNASHQAEAKTKAKEEAKVAKEIEAAAPAEETPAEEPAIEAPVEVAEAVEAPVAEEAKAEEITEAATE